jgi:hypothetical protein
MILPPPKTSFEMFKHYQVQYTILYHIGIMSVLHEIPTPEIFPPISESLHAAKANEGAFFFVNKFFY